MKSLSLAIAAGLGLAAVAATPALAAPISGYVTANVNERSGPSTAYPPIVVIPAGSSITIYGCLSDRSWCDISWGPNRGWMSSNYLQATSRRLAIRSYSAIPFITFNFGSYWDNHYRGRPFFSQRSKWSNYHWQGPNNGPGPNNPRPPMFPKPPMMGDHHPNGNYPNGGKFGNNGQFGNNDNSKTGQFSNSNKPGMGKPGYGKPGKNCWVDGKFVCGPNNQNP
jgi:uncharacterized protein YraI